MQTFGRLGVLFFLMLMFLCQLPTTGQNKKFFVITGKIVPEIETSEKGVIIMSKSGAEPTKIDIPQNGRFKLDLEYFNEYTLTFTLAGHFSKTIIVSTDIPQEVWKRDNDFPPFPMIVQLFKEIEGIDKSFTLKPSGRVFYGKQTDNFEKESIFNDIQIAEQIQTATTQTGQVKKEAQTITKQESLELAAKQKNFDQLIADADFNFKKGDYPLALTKYQEAQKLFPEKAYANDRIAELQDLLKALELTEKRKIEIEQKYKDAIARADGLFTAKTYRESQLSYKESLQYKPADAYASGRIQEIDQLLAKAEKQKQFDDLIVQADRSYKSKNFDQAITVYSQAKLLIPENEYPQNQINLINQEKQQLAQLAQQDKDFNQTIQDGDNLAKQKDFLQAINLYKKALGMKPDNKLATDKIAETEKAIAILETDKKYQETIKQADQSLAGNDLQKAKMLYQEALKLKASETYPKNKLAEIALTETNETKFIELLANAEKAISGKNYDESVNLLGQALQIKPKNAEVQKRIDDVQVLKKQQTTDKEFEQAILLGDQQKAQGLYDKAISSYRDALKIKPNNELALGKISDVEQILAGLEKDKQYQAVIAQADKSFDKKDYAAAQTDYRKSLTYKPEETYPTSRIKEIDSILQKLADDKKKEEERQLALAAKEKAYTDVIARADKAFGSESYADAKKIYTEALTIKPTEAYPTGQISKIDGILAEKARLQQIENDFLALVGKGDAAFDQKDYEVAKTNYTSALGIKPNAADVNAKIKNIDDILKKIADDKKKEEERQLALAAKEKAYTEAIARADKAFGSESYADAKKIYTEALTIKPTEAYPTGQISKIDGILAEKARLQQIENNFLALVGKGDAAFDQKDYEVAKTNYTSALGIKPNAADVNAKIKNIDDILKKIADDKKKEEERQLAAAAKEKAYTDVIARADKAFGSESYADARKIYTEALTIKPNEAYPTGQISKIDGLLAEKAKLQQIENDFLALVGKGDAAFDQKDYEVAKTNYTSALGIKPNAADVKAKIKNIDDILKKIADDKKKEEERQLALAAKEKAYTDAIARADKAFGAESYADAKKIYTEALTIKPTEAYPTGQISKIDGILAEKAKLQQIENDFLALVGKGDAAFDQKDYEIAKTNYTSALGIKPNAADVNAKIKNIDDILKKIADDKKKEEERQLALAAKEKAYTDVIARADKAFGTESYADARKIYTESLTIKPDEAYPTGQISKIDGILAEKARLQQIENDFLALVGKGDAAFDQKDYEVAKTNYTNALGIKPNAADVKAKIKNIDDILKKIADDKKKEEDRLLALSAATEKAYTDAIDKGNKQITQKTYSDARVTFQEAKKLKPSETLPDEMIAKIDSLIAGNERELADARLKEEAYQKSIKEAQEKAFNEAMAKGDKAFNENDFKSAKTGYEAALVIKVADPTAKAKLSQTEAKLAELARLTQAYNTAITAANKFVTDKRYPEAKEKYEEALQYLPDSDYPKSQIAKLNELLAQAEAERQKEELYASSMKEGETLFTAKDYSGARPLFAKASELKPAEPLPVSRMKDIDKILNDLALEESKNKTIESSYQESLKRADKALGNKEYPSARLIYGEALSIKPNEKYPKDKIAEIDQTVADLKAQQYSKAIAAGDVAFKADKLDEATTQYELALTVKANDDYAKNQLGEIANRKSGLLEEQNRLKKLNEQYDALIADAGIDLKNKEYQKSKEKYQGALALKPSETLPKEQIVIIDGLLNEARKAEETDRLYAESVKTAQEAFKQNKLTEARDTYKKAHDIKPAEPMPPQRIAELNTMIAQLEEAAKLSAMEESQRLAKEKANKEQYDKAIAIADKAFAEKQFKNSRTGYTDALNILPNESYPKDQIRKIDDLIASQEKNNLLAKEKATKDSLMRVRDAAFNLAIASAKESEQSKQYQNAILKYKEAIAINTNERANVEKMIAAVEEQIRLLELQDKQYKEKIVLADQLFNDKKLAEALAEYRNASNIKPTEEYPKNQIAEIQKLIAAGKGIYATAINNGDQAFDKSEWQNAKTAYNEALKIQPDESYPKKRLIEIDQKILAEKDAALKDAATNAAYNDAMEKGEKAMKDDQLTSAKMQFNVALKLKPNESLPPQRIREIDALIEKKNQESLAQAQRDIDEKYRQSISLADKAFKDKNYPVARPRYQEAQLIKPDESYPKDQIALIDKLMTETKPTETFADKMPEVKTAPPATQQPVARTPVARPVVNPVETTPITQVRTLTDQSLAIYDEAIRKADDEFKKESYNVAKFFYNKALDIKPLEKYPKDRIAEILALTSSMYSEKEEKAYRELIAKADEAMVGKDISIARFYYNKAIVIKKDESYPKTKLKDIQKLIDQDKLDQHNQEYNKLIELADQAMKSENFSLARFNYNKALNMKPDEKYPKDQLKHIKEAIDKPKKE